MPPQKTVKRIPVQYDPAETVEELAKELIAENHPHLANVSIAYLFKNKPIKAKGREVAATAEKASDKHRALHGYRFLITVSYPMWQELEDPIKRAVIDHELEHCWVEDDDKTGETKYKILPHDVEEFGSIILRHGLYTTNLVKLGSVVEGAKIPDDLPKGAKVYKLGKPKKAPKEDPPEDDELDDEDPDDIELVVTPPPEEADVLDDLLDFEEDEADEIDLSPPKKKKKKAKKKKVKRTKKARAKPKEKLVTVNDTTC